MFLKRPDIPLYVERCPAFAALGCERKSTHHRKPLLEGSLLIGGNHSETAQPIGPEGSRKSLATGHAAADIPVGIDETVSPGGCKHIALSLMLR